MNQAPNVPVLFKNLLSMKLHPIYGKLFNRLNKQEHYLIREFIIAHADLNNDDYTLKANRWFLDRADRPKHLNDMWAIVTQVRGYKAI